MELSGLNKITFYKPERCDSCGGELTYKGIGRYLCADCGKELLDDYGTLKEYFRVHGPTPLLIAARETGMSKDKIRYILDGRYTEIPTADAQTAKRALFADNLKNYR